MVHEGRLESFVKAKQKINELFKFLKVLLQHCIERLCESQSYIVTDLKDFSDQASGLLVQVSSITEVLARDQMKVAFFGRTSSGKSTTLNAMLQDKVLPMGCGKTTNCFLSVRGSDQPHAYILTADSNIKRDVTSLSQLANALCDDKPGHGSLVQVFWPKTRCKLLSEDVVLVDSPGIDLSPDLDLWIDKRCLDADVFVLVVNAESTLTLTEKKFFHKVNQRLSQPNIFILSNGWDPSASEPNKMELVKNKHRQKNISFLVDELKCVDQARAGDRVFFVSSKETLMTRIQKHKWMPQEGGARHDEGFQARQMEFETFERKLEECISKSAIQTKFEPHATSGLKIAKRMKDIMEEVEGLASQQRSLLEKAKKEKEDQLECITRLLETYNRKVQSTIEEIQSTVEKQVADAMAETIGRLRSLVSEFNHPFHLHPSFLKTYKKELLGYLERELEGNMTYSQTQLINDAQRDLAECLRGVPPQERPENVLELDATSLDFQSSFKPYIRTLRLGIVLEANPQRSGRSFASTAQYNTLSLSMEEVENSAQCVGVVSSIVTGLINLASHPGTWMVIAAAGLFLRPNCLEYMLLVLGLCVGGVVIKWFRWNNEAKGKAKEQFVDHATENLQQWTLSAVDSISAKFSNQFQRTLWKLESLVQREKKSVKENLIKLREEIIKLEEVEKEAEILRVNAIVVQRELSQFMTDFGLTKRKI